MQMSHGRWTDHRKLTTVDRSTPFSQSHDEVLFSFYSDQKETEKFFHIFFFIWVFAFMVGTCLHPLVESLVGLTVSASGRGSPSTAPPKEQLPLCNPPDSSFRAKDSSYGGLLLWQPRVHVSCFSASPSGDWNASFHKLCWFHPRRPRNKRNGSLKREALAHSTRQPFPLLQYLCVSVSPRTLLLSILNNWCHSALFFLYFLPLRYWVTLLVLSPGNQSNSELQSHVSKAG